MQEQADDGGGVVCILQKIQIFPKGGERTHPWVTPVPVIQESDATIHGLTWCLPTVGERAGDQLAGGDGHCELEELMVEEFRSNHFERLSPQWCQCDTGRSAVQC